MTYGKQESEIGELRLVFVGGLVAGLLVFWVYFELNVRFLRVFLDGVGSRERKTFQHGRFCLL